MLLLKYLLAVINSYNGILAFLEIRIVVIQMLIKQYKTFKADIQPEEICCR